MKELLPLRIWGEEDGYGPISMLSFSSNGKLAVGAGHGVCVYDLAHPATTEDDILFRTPSTFMPSLAWSPDGRFLAICWGKVVVVYDATGEKCAEHAHDGEAKVVSWSPDGTQLASCSEYGQYHCWELATGQTKQQITFTLTPPFLLWLPDGRIATNPFIHPEGAFLPKASSWQVQIWSAGQTSVEFLLDDLTRRCDHYTTAAVSPDASLLALGNDAGCVQVWSLGEPPHLLQEYPFHVAAISGAVWGPGAKALATCSRDGHVAVWNAWGELRYHTGWKGDQREARGIAWWNDLLATASDDGEIAFYRVPEDL